MKLIDTHAHLQFDAFDKDRDEIWALSQKSGVARMLIVGTEPATNRLALDWTHGKTDVYPTVGWHPHDAKEWTEEAWQDCRRMAGESQVVAIGEVGLDYFRNLSSVQEQQHVFRQAIRLARELDKPLIVHSRDAHTDVLSAIREEGDGRVQGVMHCFSADQACAQAALELGFYISFSATITYPKNDALRAVAMFVPAERLLMETDCPFLPPQSRRGERNDPTGVRSVLETLAKVRRAGVETLAQEIWENAQRLFKLPMDA